MGTATEKRRRQRGEGSVYFDASKGLWYGTVDLGYVGGKRKRKKVSGKSQTEVIKKRQQAARAVESGDRSTSSMTLAKWLDYWLKEIKQPKLKPTTYWSYKNQVKLYIVPAIGRVRLDKLEPRHVRDLQRFMSQKGLSNGTIIRSHRILSSALSTAMREGKVHRNVARIEEAPAAKGRTRRPLTMDEVERFLRAVQEDRLAARWLVAFTTGLRQGEVLGMTWANLDLENGAYLLEWQLQRVPYTHGCGEETPKGWPCGRRGDRCTDRHLSLPRDFLFRPLETNFVLQETKTRKNRLVHLPESVILALRLRYAAYLEERESWTTDHGLVFTREDGRPVDNSQDEADWHAILQRAEIPDDTTQHAARHTVASRLLAMGVSEKTIMDVLGHSEIVTTRGYMHDDLTLSRLAMAGLGEEIGRLVPAAAPESNV